MMKNLFQILCGLFLVVSYSSCMHSEEDKVDVLIINGSLKFEITAKRLYAASQRVL